MKRVRRWGYEHATEIALFLATCLLLAAACGCTTALKTVKVAEYTASEVIATGYRSVVIYNEAKLTSIREKAVSGHLQEAETELSVYLPVYTKVFKTLDDAAGLLDAVDKSIVAVMAGVKSPSSLLLYVPQLVQAAAAVRAALQELGVTL